MYFQLCFFLEVMFVSRRSMSGIFLPGMGQIMILKYKFKAKIHWHTNWNRVSGFFIGYWIFKRSGFLSGPFLFYIRSDFLLLYWKSYSYKWLRIPVTYHSTGVTKYWKLWLQSIIALKKQILKKPIQSWKTFNPEIRKKPPSPIRKKPPSPIRKNRPVRSEEFPKSKSTYPWKPEQKRRLFFFFLS